MTTLHQKLKSKRLAIYLPSLGGGGAERIMVTLANAFASRGIKTDLVLAKAEGPYLNEVSANVRVVALGASRVATSLPALMSYLRQEQPDAILSALTHANVIALLARRLTCVKTRLVVSEHISLRPALRHATLWRSRWLMYFMRWTYPWADGVIAVSKGVADDLVASTGLSKDRIDYIYNPIGASVLRQKAEQPFWHPWFALGEPPVVLGAGRLTAQKDFATLIRAVAKLCKFRRVRLVILGEGELRSNLQALIDELGLSEDVIMPGFCENPFGWMQKADLFVLSSVFEGLPGVLIEAMSYDLPVVSTDCPSGPSEILENGRWGRLVPVGDVDALAHAMLNTLDDVARPDVAVRAADFSVDSAVASYLRMLGFEELHK
jgi:glycosyltransferase involved in cell wall biosynthesis